MPTYKHVSSSSLHHLHRLPYDQYLALAPYLLPISKFGAYARDYRRRKSAMTAETGRVGVGCGGVNIGAEMDLMCHVIATGF